MLISIVLRINKDYAPRLGLSEPFRKAFTERIHLNRDTRKGQAH